MKRVLVSLGLVWSLSTIELGEIGIRESRASGVQPSEHPCAGQASRTQDGQWAGDYRYGSYRCWCNGKLFLLDSPGNPCRDEKFLKERAEKALKEKEDVAKNKMNRDCPTCGRVPDVVASVSGVKEVAENLPSPSVDAPTPVISPRVKKTSLPRPSWGKIQKRNFQEKIRSDIKLRELSENFKGNEVIYKNPAAAKREMSYLVRLLKEHPNVRIGLYGVTNSRGRKEWIQHYAKKHPTYSEAALLELIYVTTRDDRQIKLREFIEAEDSFNRRLAPARAQAAVHLLIQLGLPKDRILFTKGAEPGKLLKNRPKDILEDEPRNRRLLIEYFDQQGKSLNPIDPNREDYP